MFRLLILLFLGMAENLYASNCCKTRIDSVLIYFTDWSVVTGYDITCSEFFDIAQRKYIITDSEIINNLLHEINCLKPEKAHGLDVRCKVLFFVGDSIDASVCLNTGLLLNRGRLFKVSEKLLLMINKIVDYVPWVKPTKGEQNKKESVVVYGKQEIVSAISKLMEDKWNDIPDGSLKIFAKCKVDIYGSTFDVSLPKLSTKISQYMKLQILSIITKYLKWNYNAERSPTESYLWSVEIKKER